MYKKSPRSVMIFCDVKWKTYDSNILNMYECFQPDCDISQGNHFQVSFLVINIKRTDCTQSKRQRL